MTLIEWEPKFDLSVPKIDTDHRHLVDLINGIHEQLRNGDPRPVVIRRFVELYSSAAKHFACEEAIMQAGGYSRHFLKHYADHQRLLNEVTFMMYEYQYGFLKDHDLIAERLHAWFSDHFYNYDARWPR